MPGPRLPRYHSSEVNHFHPAFKWAFGEQLAARGLDGRYSLEHHFPISTGTVDFVLIDTATRNVIFPIEIKRTQTDVRGSGRRQARDYWNNLGRLCTTDFYCVSNLELTELFRHDTGRHLTASQQVRPANAIAGILETTSEPDFYRNLMDVIDKVLDIVLRIVPHQYLPGMTHLQQELVRNPDDLDRWHQILQPSCFDYIRGTASTQPHILTPANRWRTAQYYESNPRRIQSLGSDLDFFDIFCDPITGAGDTTAFNRGLLSEAYTSGEALGAGDDLGALVTDVIDDITNPGVVETDTELAQLLSVFARVALGKELTEEEEIFDPGAASGTLLKVLPGLSFSSITPKQLRANEKEARFKEALSLRLGLAFSSVISPTNAPKITISPIETIDRADLAQVKVVVMNPPFLSGISSVVEKAEFATRIRAVSGDTSLLNYGQIALEALFLELVWHLVPEDTVIATVFPTQHLYRQSDEVVRLRQFLTNEFGLKCIVSYPRTGLFTTVIKETVLLVGQKGSTNPDVQLVEVQMPVGDLDLAELHVNLASGSAAPSRGISIRQIARTDLETQASRGWKRVVGSGSRAASFVNRVMAGYSTLNDLNLSSGTKAYRRGTLNNKGNRELTGFDPVSPLYPAVVAQIPARWLRGALINTRDLPRLLNRANAPRSSFLPPDSAYDPSQADYTSLMGIIDAYLRDHTSTGGRQPRTAKTRDDIRNDLRSDQKSFGKGFVIIPRGARANGQVSVCDDDDVLFSTNVILARISNTQPRTLLASWILSVFGQLQLELASAPQEGMRKLEVHPVGFVSYPDLGAINPAIKQELLDNFPTEPAIELTKICERPSDHLWAKVVAPKNPAACLNQALDLLNELVDCRSAGA